MYRKLYDSLVSPVFDYGAPIWSHYCSTADLKKIQNRAYRFFHRRHMCWIPTKRRHQLQTLSFGITYYEKGISRRVFLECTKIAEEEHFRNCSSEVRCILAECNLLPWWQNNFCGNGLNCNEFRNVVLCCLFRFEQEKWKMEVIGKSELRTYYATFKERYEPEEYIERIRCKAQQSVVAQLR